MRITRHQLRRVIRETMSQYPAKGKGSRGVNKAYKEYGIQVGDTVALKDDPTWYGEIGSIHSAINPGDHPDPRNAPPTLNVVIAQDSPHWDRWKTTSTVHADQVTLLREAFDDIQAINMRVRVDVDSADDPSLQDILTTLRGLPNVITVAQEKALEDAPGGRQMATLIVKFENAPAVDIPTLRNQVEALPTVDLVTVLTVDGRGYNKEEGQKDAARARSAKAVAFQKQRKLGQWTDTTEGKMMVTKKRVQQIIKEEVSRKLFETAGGHFLTGLKHEYGVGLNAQEIAATMAFVDGGDDTGFMTAYRKDPKYGYDVTPYDIFFGYYQDEMPYGTQKARDGDPYEWIALRLEDELALSDPVKEGLLREASIEVDWVGDVGELQSIPQNLSFELIDPSGPGGGAAVVVVTGEREALKNWYVWDYSADDLHQDAGADFDEFVRE